MSTPTEINTPTPESSESVIDAREESVPVTNEDLAKRLQSLEAHVLALATRFENVMSKAEAFMDKMPKFPGIPKFGA